MCKIRSKLTIKTSERRQDGAQIVNPLLVSNSLLINRSGVLIIDFEYISHIFDCEQINVSDPVDHSQLTFTRSN